MFDILPLSGVLSPGQTQQIQFTFYGHSCLSAMAIAVCQVDGGPSYHLTLKGEASGVSHQISRTEIPLGEVVSVLEMLWISWQIKCSLIYKCVSKWKLHKLLNTGITIHCTYVTLYTTYTTYFTIHMEYTVDLRIVYVTICVSSLFPFFSIYTYLLPSPPSVV